MTPEEHDRTKEMTGRIEELAYEFLAPLAKDRLVLEQDSPSAGITYIRSGDGTIRVRISMTIDLSGDLSGGAAATSAHRDVRNATW